MKKKVVLLLAATMIVSALSGCGMTKKESEAMITDISNADMLKTADEKSLINSDEAVKAFSDALDKVKKEKNITIDTTTTTNLGEGDKAENAINTSKLKKDVTDDKSTASVELTNDYTGQKSKVSGYYDGKTLFFTSTATNESTKKDETQKIKEEMSFDDFLSIIDSYSLNLYEENIEKASLETKKDGSKIFKIAYNPEKLQATMQTNIEAAGQSLPDGQTMKVNFSNVEAKVNKDGNLTSFAFKIDAKYVSDKEESPYNYTIVADFTNFGKTKVDVVTKTDDYKDASEIQQEQAAETTTDSLESAPQVTTTNQPDPTAK